MLENPETESHDFGLIWSFRLFCLKVGCLVSNLFQVKLSRLLILRSEHGEYFKTSLILLAHGLMSYCSFSEGSYIQS